MDISQIFTKFFKPIIYGILAAMIMFMSTFTVQQYEQGVVTTFGKISWVAGPGLGFKIPFAQSVELIRTDILVVEPKEKVNTYTSDNQEIDISFRVFYRVPINKIAYVYENIPDYRQRLFNVANDRLKVEMGKVKLEHFAESRGVIRDKVKEVIKNDAITLGVEVTDFQFTDVEYTKEFRNAVNQASVSKAQVEKREWDRVQAEKMALTAKINAEGTANAVREAAKGDADAIDVKAQAEARAIQVKGEATAAAMKAQAEALARNPVLVEMKKAETWDGKLPTAIYAGAPIPFMSVK